MSNPHQSAPTLNAVLIAHAEQMRLRTGISHEEWAERVDAKYHELVPERHRSLPAPGLHDVHDAAAYRKLLRAWDQNIRRYVDGSLKFPMELEEAWIEALDEPWRTDCKRERSRRMGMVGAAIPEPGPAGDHRTWGNALQEFGRMTQTMGEVLSDGVIDGSDAKDLPTLLNQIHAMQANLTSLEEKVNEALGEAQGTVREIRRA